MREIKLRNLLDGLRPLGHRLGGRGYSHGSALLLYLPTLFSTYESLESIEIFLSEVDTLAVHLFDEELDDADALSELQYDLVARLVARVTHGNAVGELSIHFVISTNGKRYDVFNRRRIGIKFVLRSSHLHVARWAALPNPTGSNRTVPDLVVLRPGNHGFNSFPPWKREELKRRSEHGLQFIAVFNSDRFTHLGCRGERFVDSNSTTSDLNGRCRSHPT